jgi:hypothetical protein
MALYKKIIFKPKGLDPFEKRKTFFASYLTEVMIETAPILCYSNQANIKQAK